MANYKKSNYKQSGPPNTFTALITLPDGTIRRFPQCKIWNGVLVYLISVGKGKKTEHFFRTAEGEGDSVEEWEYYAYVPKPLYCRAKQTEQQMTEIMRVDGECAKKKDWSLCFEKYAFAMFTMGDNGHGYKVEDEKEVEDRKIQENKTATVYGGFRGFKIAERLPSDIWNKLRPYATFYKKEEIADWYEDMDEFWSVGNASRESGWNYDPQIIDILGGMGWKVSYRGHEVTSLAQTDEIDKLIAEKEAKEKAEADLRKQQEKALLAEYHALGFTFELMKEQETEAISDLPRIEIKMLNWNGTHLYGVGRWGKIDNDYLYSISQNGHDGDDWSRNNSREGIVHRTALTPELADIIRRMIEFEAKS